MRASRFFTIAILTASLTIGTTVNAQTSKKGFEGIENGDLKEVYKFVKDFNVDYKHPTKRITPLSYAIMKGQDQTALYLIAAGADVNYKSNNFSPLYWAIHYNRVAVVKKMLENGAEFSTEKERTLAMNKVDMKNHSAIKTLLTSL